MHVCGMVAEGRERTRQRRACRWPGLLLALALVAPAVVAATPDEREPSPPFELPTASVRLVDNVYRLDAVARLRLTPDVRSALDNGVDLTLTWEALIERPREWWLDAEVAHIFQRYRLSFHELTLQYVVTNVNTGQQRSFARLRAALDHVGNLAGFPLVDRVLVEGDEGLVGHVRIGLQHDELPLPLRAVALFDDDWDLRTEWRQWLFD